MGGWEWMCESMLVFTMPFLCVDSGPWRRMSRAWPPMSAITTSSGSTCPNHRESTWVAAELRQERLLWLLLLRVLLPADVVEHIYKCFCQYCPRRGGLRRVAVVRSRCQVCRPSPTSTMDRKTTTKRTRHVWWVEGFSVCFRSLSGCMGMDVWVNVFKMSFLCADSEPWRRMFRAWPPMSAITTSGSTCPCHQEPAWGAAEARQEWDIMEVVKKGIVVAKCWSLCWTHLQMCFVSSVLGEKASDVEQSRRESAKLPGRRPPPPWTGRGQLNQGVAFSELMVLLFVLGVCMGGWEWMCEWMFAFTLPFLCADSWPWRTMSRAWPPMSEITGSWGSTCPRHQESAWGGAEASQERVYCGGC